MRVLIAGLGSIGQRHLRNLLQLGMSEISLFRTGTGEIEDAQQLPVFTSPDDALSTNPDVVIVSNPTALHLGVAIKAAKAGLNLFIEKPLSHTWEGVEELLAIVEKKQLITLMGFDLRFDPGLIKTQTLLANNEIGKVVSIHASVGQYLPDWRPAQDYREGMSASVEKGGGVILDLIHELDYTSWLFGPVAQISCVCGHISNLEIETEDVAAMLLQFESGIIGTVNLDYIQRVPHRTCRIVGEKGTIVWDYFGNKVSWFKADTNSWEEFDYNQFDRNDRFLNEMRHLVACIQGSEKPSVDVFEGSRILKLALAAKESAASGKSIKLESSKI